MIGTKMVIGKSRHNCQLLCILSAVLLLSACDAPPEARQATTLAAGAQKEVAEKPVDVPHQPQARSHSAGSTFSTAPIGTWQIVKVYAGRFNAGSWAQDDEQIVGVKFIWADDSALLAWGDPENVSFDQREKCQKPILVSATDFQDKEIAAALRQWKLPADRIKLAKTVECTGGGRWGVPQTASAGQYAIFVPISDTEMAMAIFPDLVFLARR
jgi:hypothetical protein